MKSNKYPSILLCGAMSIMIIGCNGNAKTTPLANADNTAKEMVSDSIIDPVESNGTVDDGVEESVKVVATSQLQQLSMNDIPFKTKEVKTVASDDGRMIFYCWDTEEGGSMPMLGWACQYIGESGKKHLVDMRSEEGDIGAWVNSMNTIQKNDGSKFYLVKCSQRLSGMDGFLWVDGFKVKGDDLYKISLNGGDLEGDSLFSVEYDMIDWYDAAGGFGQDWAFHYDETKRDLYVPLTKEYGFPPCITDRYQFYHFNGNRFVNQGVRSHWGLHSSVADYERLLCYFPTKGYIVRIDQLEDGTMRYSSWKASNGTSSAPELVIFGGKETTINYSKAYVFVNDGVEYTVGHNENVKAADGYSYSHQYLLVKKDGKVLLKQEKIDPET